MIRNGGVFDRQHFSKEKGSIMRNMNNLGYGYPDYDKDVDLCLVAPPSRASSMALPISLLFLSAWCNKNGINTRIVDVKKEKMDLIKQGNDESIFEEIINEVVSLHPKIVGFTAFTTDYFDVMTLAEGVKKKINPVIVAGGIHAQISPEDFFVEGSPINFVAIGDGEDTLVKLARAIIDRSNEFNNIPKLARREGPDIIINSSIQSENFDYSQMPLVPYWDLDMEFYAKPNKGLIRFLLASGIHIFTALGCPYQCTFCANQDKNIKFRPIEKVIEEIQFCKEHYDIDAFYIQDDTFCMNPKRVHEFIDKLSSLPYKFFWGCETRVNLLNHDLLRKLKRSGCIQIDFGVESGSQHMLNRMKKGITVNQIKNAFELCKQEKMRTLANFMFNTPEETEEDVANTYAITDTIRPTIVICGLTVPYLGTPIYKEYVKPPLSIQEYKMYITRAYKRDSADMFKNRFRLAKHNLDLKEIQFNYLKKHMIVKRFLDLTSNWCYWSVLIRSRRKLDYMIEFTKEMIVSAYFIATRVKAMIFTGNTKS